MVDCVQPLLQPFNVLADRSKQMPHFQGRLLGLADDEHGAAGHVLDGGQVEDLAQGLAEQVGLAVSGQFQPQGEGVAQQAGMGGGAVFGSHSSSPLLSASFGALTLTFSSPTTSTVRPSSIV